MTKIISEGRMIITRINLKALKIPPMKGEAIVRDIEQGKKPAPEEDAQAKGEKT